MTIQRPANRGAAEVSQSDDRELAGHRGDDRDGEGHAAALKRDEELGLNPDEIAFYDALAEKPEVLQTMGDATLKKRASELTEKLALQHDGGLAGARERPCEDETFDQATPPKI